MSKKQITLKDAEDIVSTHRRVKYLTEELGRYSINRLDGKKYSVALIGDSRHFTVGDMLNNLPEDDRTAINRYIVKRIKKVIRDGKAQMKNLGTIVQ